LCGKIRSFGHRFGRGSEGYDTRPVGTDSNGELPSAKVIRKLLPNGSVTHRFSSNSGSYSSYIQCANTRTDIEVSEPEGKQLSEYEGSLPSLDVPLNSETSSKEEAYPTAFGDACLKEMSTLRRAFGATFAAASCGRSTVTSVELPSSPHSSRTLQTVHSKMRLWLFDDEDR
jgi:hypothetical protein